MGAKIAAIAVLALSLAIAPQSAASAASDLDFMHGSADQYYQRCGRYWPTQNQFQTLHSAGTDLYMASWRFRLSPTELGNLECLGREFNAELLEVEFRLIGFDGVDDWDSYSVSGNLPGGLHDVAYRDKAVNAAPAATNFSIADLRPDRDYHVTISWHNGTGLYPVLGQSQGVSFRWVPSHWARIGNIVETGSCARGTLLLNWAWCVFPTAWAFVSDGYRNQAPAPFDEWQMFTYPTGVSSPVPPQLFHGTPPDGVIVQSTEGHLYVAAGGRLFWFDRNNAAQLAAFQAQRNSRYGNVPYPVMDVTEVHAIEVNRDDSGAYAPGSHMPVDNTWLYEYGSLQQYVVKFQYPFPVGSPEEVVALGGQDQAVMVPASIADLRTRSPQWVRDDLLRFWNDPTVWHYVDRGFRVPDVPTRDCLMVRWSRGVTLMPASAWNYFPTHPTQPAACDFTHGQWLYGVPSNRQIEVLYGVGHYVQYGEVSALGGTNRAVPVTDVTLDQLLGRPLNVPEHHLFKPANEPTVYQMQGGQFHAVGSPPVRDCLMATYGVVVETVPRSFIDRLPLGAGAQCPYEGRLLLHPNGITVDYVQNGQRHHVQNPAIRDCLMGRAGTGQPIAVEQWVWDSYGQGADAFCPYGQGFVQENNSPTVWLVHPDGTKQHVGSLCVPDPYTTQLFEWRVWIVPAGEPAGHVQGPDWFATPDSCLALRS